MKSEVQLLQDRLVKADEVMRKSAAYVEQAQSELDKQAAASERFEKRAREVAGVLAHRGVIPAGETELLIRKLAEDKIRALDLVERLAQLVGPDQMGKQADITLPTGRRLDAFEALVLNGDPSKTTVESPLSIQ